MLIRLSAVLNFKLTNLLSKKMLLLMNITNYVRSSEDVILYLPAFFGAIKISQPKDLENV